MDARRPAARRDSLEQAVTFVELAARVVDPWGHDVQLGYGTSSVDPGLYFPATQTTHFLVVVDHVLPGWQSAGKAVHAGGRFVRACVRGQQGPCARASLQRCVDACIHHV